MAKSRSRLMLSCFRAVYSAITSSGLLLDMGLPRFGEEHDQLVELERLTGAEHRTLALQTGSVFLQFARAVPLEHDAAIDDALGGPHRHVLHAVPMRTPARLIRMTTPRRVHWPRTHF